MPPDNRTDYRTPITILAFYGLFLLGLLSAPTVQGLFARILEMQSEYTVNEQLSKYFVFIALLISVFAYERLTNPLDLKISIGFICFSISLYCAESNMISGTTQPIFGFLYLAYTLPLLIAARAWKVIAFQGLALTLMGVGFFGDFVIKHQAFFSANMPLAVTILGNSRDELYEVLGLASISLSVALCFLEPLSDFVSKNKLGTTMILISAAFVTSGNSFMHYSYHPGTRLVLAGLALSLTGLAGLLLSYRHLNAKALRFPPLISPEYSGVLLFVLFILLPMIHGGHHPHIVSLFVWLPFILLIAYHLFRQKQLFPKHHE